MIAQKDNLAACAWLWGLWIAVYNGSSYLASLRPQVSTCALPGEDRWPFVPELILAYWSTHLLFIAAPLLCRGRLLRQHVKRVTLALGICGVCFVAWPLTLPWPPPAVSGWTGPFFAALLHFHNRYNCAPSLHIALITLLWPVYVTPRKGRARVVMAAVLGAGWLSTLLCRQHTLFDVATGQLLGGFCLWLFPL